MDSEQVGYEAYPSDATNRNTKFIDLLSGHFKPVLLEVRVDAPHRSGLGASGSLGVATIGCLNTLNTDNPMDLYQIAELAYSVEHDELGFAGGRQDQYASCFGGFNYIRFEGNKVSVSRLDIKPETLLSLEKSMFLVFTHPRSAGNVMEEEVSRVNANEDETLRALGEQRELANQVRKSLITDNLPLFGELMDSAWQIKKRQSPLVTNGLIDELYDRVKKAGALGGKLVGAGGGGYFVVFAPGVETKVCDAISSLNLRPETIILDWMGLKVWK